MKKNEKLWTTGALAAVGSSLLALVSVNNQFSFLIPSEYEDGIWVFLAILGSIFIISSALFWAVSRITIPALMPIYECYPARRSEFSKIHQMGVEFLGEDISPLSKMHSWHNINRDIFRVLYRVKKSSSGKTKTFVGYYCITPITENGAHILEKNEIRGSAFLAEHIVKQNRKPYAIYIGGLCAKGLLARGNLRSVVYNEVRNHWAKRTKIIYTRPVTKDGLRLVADYNFYPVWPREAGKIDCLYKFEFDT